MQRNLPPLAFAICALLCFFDMLTGDFSDNLTRINVNQFQNYCANAMHLWFVNACYYYRCCSTCCYCFIIATNCYRSLAQLLLSFAIWLAGWLVGSLAGARLTGCCNAKRSQPIAGLWQCPCCYCCNCSAYKGISAMRKSRVQQIAWGRSQMKIDLP